MPDLETTLIMEALGAIGDSIDDPILKSRIKECQSTYLEAVTEAASKPDEAPERKDLKQYQDALAKGLPDTAKGLFAAISAFQSGNAEEGLASVMDTCASVFTTIGGLVGGATGLPVVGAVFAVFSQFIRFMRKKSEATKDQFEKVLRALQAEATFQAILTAQNAIKRFDTALAEAVSKVHGAGDVATVRELLRSLNTIEGDAITKITFVCQWLETSGNQNQARWPDVLGAVCRTYADRTISAAKVCEIVAALHEKLTAAPAAEKPHIEAQMAKLLSSINAFIIGVHADHPRHLQFLDAITSAARNRGTVWSIHRQHREARGPVMSGGGDLFARDRVIGDEAPLFGILRGPDESRSLAVVRTRQHEEPSPYPYLSMVVRQPADRGGRVYIRHGQWPLTGTDGWHELEMFKGCLDIQLGSMPIAEEGKEKVDRLYFVVASGDGTVLNEFLENATSKAIEPMGPLADTAGTGSVSTVRMVLQPRPVAYFANHDRLIYSRWSLAGEDRPVNLCCHRYAKDPKTPERRTIATPFETGYAGITADRTYVWLFNEGMIACAAHEDIAKDESSPVSKGVWMTYKIPDEIGGYDPSQRYRNDPYNSDEHYFGLFDLSACDDGTLVAVYYQRHETYHFRTRTYAITRKIDRANKTLAFDGQKRDERGNVVKTSGWVQCWSEGTTPIFRAYKQPIFCWPLMESTRAALQKPVS